MLRILLRSGIQLGHILPLADPNVADGEARIETFYTWYVDRTMAAARGAFGTAGALFIALATAILSDGSEPSGLQTAVIAGVGLGFTLVGFVLLRRLGVLYVEFAHTVRAVGRLRRLLQLLFP